MAFLTAITNDDWVLVSYGSNPQTGEKYLTRKVGPFAVTVADGLVQAYTATTVADPYANHVKWPTESGGTWYAKAYVERDDAGREAWIVQSLAQYSTSEDYDELTQIKSDPSDSDEPLVEIERVWHKRDATTKATLTAITVPEEGDPSGTGTAVAGWTDTGEDAATGIAWNQGWTRVIDHHDGSFTIIQHLVNSSYAGAGSSVPVSYGNYTYSWDQRAESGNGTETRHCAVTWHAASSGTAAATVLNNKTCFPGSDMQLVKGVLWKVTRIYKQ